MPGIWLADLPAAALAASGPGVAFAHVPCPPVPQTLLSQIIHYPVNHFPARNATRDLLTQLTGRRPLFPGYNTVEVLVFFAATLGLSLVRCRYGAGGGERAGGVSRGRPLMRARPHALCEGGCCVRRGGLNFTRLPSCTRLPYAPHLLCCAACRSLRIWDRCSRSLEAPAAPSSFLGCRGPCCCRCAGSGRRRRCSSGWRGASLHVADVGAACGPSHGLLHTECLLSDFPSPSCPRSTLQYAYNKHLHLQDGSLLIYRCVVGRGAGAVHGQRMMGRGFATGKARRLPDRPTCKV